MRCFISIELPESLKKEIAEKTAKLRALDADVKWIVPENLHLTLKFLGETPEEIVPAVKETLAKTAARFGKFNLDFSGLGVFPDARRPRVLWVGVLDSESLLSLQRDAEEGMKEFGFEAEDRAFSAHLTIGRVRSPKGKERLVREIEALKDASFGWVEVAEMSFMKSELKPSGAKYTVLFVVPLGR